MPTTVLPPGPRAECPVSLAVRDPGAPLIHGFRMSGLPILLAAQPSLSLRRAAGTLQNFFDFFDGNSQAKGRDLSAQELGVFWSGVVKRLGQ